jgi:hypothetical protein
LLNNRRNKDIRYENIIDAYGAAEQEGICENLIYAEFVLESWHYLEIYLV